jgi:hypothetical protein
VWRGIVCFVPPDHAWLSIVFDLQADPIAGVVCDHAGHGLPFAGWMELTRTIERALDEAKHAAAGAG